MHTDLQGKQSSQDRGYSNSTHWANTSHKDREHSGSNMQGKQPPQHRESIVPKGRSREQEMRKRQETARKKLATKGKEGKEKDSQ